MGVTPSAEQLDRQFPAIGAEHWGIDPETTFLNHGSFGACPKPILAEQRRLREMMESNPLRFLLDEAPPLLRQSKAKLALLMNAPPEDVVFVQSATAGVNAVLRSLQFEQGDEVLMLDQSYSACINVVQHVCERSGAVPVIAQLPWPCEDPQQVVDSILEKVTARTRLAMIDHINSNTAMILPIVEIVDRLNQIGVDVLIDGAHTLGQVPVDVKALGAAYFVSNCHKWLCGPKAAAVLYVRPDCQAGIEPTIISHGSTPANTNATSIQDRFAWQGTADPTPAICAGSSLTFLEQLMPNGLYELMQRNHAMAVAMRRILCDSWGIQPPCPYEMIGSMATLPIGQGFDEADQSPEAQALYRFIQDLRFKHRIECQPRCFGDPLQFTIRISCHAYSSGKEVLDVVSCFSPWVNPH